VQTPIITQADEPLFKGMGKEFPAGRYHSWVVSKKDFPSFLEITALSKEGYIMGLRHVRYDVHGIQFHPESILTPDGKKIIKNFLTL
jgi:anthranilate synthase component 2